MRRRRKMPRCEAACPLAHQRRTACIEWRPVILRRLEQAVGPAPVPTGQKTSNGPLRPQATELGRRLRNDVWATRDRLLSWTETRPLALKIKEEVDLSGNMILLSSHNLLRGFHSPRPQRKALTILRAYVHHRRSITAQEGADRRQLLLSPPPRSTTPRYRVTSISTDVRAGRSRY